MEPSSSSSSCNAITPLTKLVEAVSVVVGRGRFGCIKDGAEGSGGGPGGRGRSDMLEGILSDPAVGCVSGSNGLREGREEARRTVLEFRNQSPSINNRFVLGWNQLAEDKF